MDNKNNYVSPLSNGAKKDKDLLVLSSKKKWFWLAVTIAILNPVFSGILLGITFLSEKELKKQAKIILLISVVWGLALLYLSNWLVRNGYMPY